MFDPSCRDLAQYFLPVDAPEPVVEALSQHIQDAVESWLGDYEDPVRRRRLTRQEQLEGLADRGVDTHEERKEER